MAAVPWTYEDIHIALEAIRGGPGGVVAAQTAAKATGRPGLTRQALSRAFRRACDRGWISERLSDITYRPPPPTTDTGGKTTLTKTPSTKTTEADDRLVPHLDVVRAVQGGARTLIDLANALDCSPKSAQQRADAAIEAGHTIALNDAGELVFELPRPETHVIPDVPRDGDWTKIAVISDLHVGSKHCFEQEIGTFVTEAHSRGYTSILIPGDLCEGNLRHHGFEYEVKAFGFDAQLQLLLQTLPELPGLTYHFCVGNHEVNSWWKSIGLRPDIAIERHAHANGRTDLLASGAMLPNMESAYLLLNPGDPETEIKVELSHTGDKKAYAMSYPLQKHVEAYLPGSKPHLLLKGHLHCWTAHDIRGVVCVQTACFKGQGAWERSKNMQPTIGGTLIDLKHEGRYFDFRVEPRFARPAPLVWTPIEG